jgi:flagellar motor switch protein FliN/FliY
MSMDAPTDTITESEIQFEALSAPEPGIVTGGADLGRVIDVPVELAVEIGRTTMTIGETLSLAPGSIVSLNRLAGEPVDLLVNGKVIAQGEVVVIDEEFGLRITDIVSTAQRLSDAAAPAE